MNSVKSMLKIVPLLVIFYACEAQSQVVVHRRVAVVRPRPYYYPHYYHPVVVRPRVIVPYPTVVVGALPPSYVTVYAGNTPYYYCDGVYYIKDPSSEAYTKAQPVVGTIVPELPEGQKKIVIDGKTYYQFEGVIYKKVTVEKKTRYEVVSVGKI
ncbi:DUF6515 family protein [Sinomicrobium sp. M5D2P17]